MNWNPDLKIKLFLNKIEMLVSIKYLCSVWKLVTSMGEDVTDMKEYDEYSIRELSAKITDRVR